MCCASSVSALPPWRTCTSHPPLTNAFWTLSLLLTLSQCFPQQAGSLCADFSMKAVVFHCVGMKRIRTVALWQESEERWLISELNNAIHMWDHTSSPKTTSVAIAFPHCPGQPTSRSSKTPGPSLLSPPMAVETTRLFQLRHHVWPAWDELAIITHILPELETHRKLEGIKWQSLQLLADEISNFSRGGELSYLETLDILQHATLGC